MARKLTESTYNQRVRGVYRRHKKRIEMLLNGIIAAMREAGFKMDDLADWSDDEYTWNFVTRLESSEGEDYSEGDMDHTFTIVESLARDGSLDGVSFGLSSCYNGGRIGGPSCTPYNYSDDLWVPVTDISAVNDRFDLMASILENTSEFVYCMEQIRDGLD